MFSKELFGQRLRALRKQNKENQDALAAVLGIKKAQVSEVESGHNTTTLEKLALICKHYKVSADYLLGLSDDPTPRQKGGDQV